MNWEIIVTTVGMVVASGLTGYLAYRASERSNKRSQETQRLVSEKASSSSDLQKWTEQVVLRLTKVEEDRDELMTRVGRLEEELRATRSLLSASTEFIRYLLSRLSHFGEIVTVPHSLRDLVGRS